MNFIKKIFVRRPEDFVAKGDALFAAGSYFEARSAYEDGLGCCSGKPGDEELIQALSTKIADANRALAALNIDEAGHAFKRGDIVRAVEHIELAKTLTDDSNIREKAELLLAGMIKKTNDTEVLASPSPAHSSCTSCSNTAVDPLEAFNDIDPDLDPLVHYDLLIHQLPEEMYTRYAALGEEFAYVYVTASLDKHQEALELLEKWFDGSHRDIYCYEKGKILHRLGSISASETCMLEAIRENIHNPLPHLGLALLYIDENRLEDASRQIDTMIAADIFSGQAMMMRGEVFELSGDLEGAISQYGGLLETPIARSAAERLHPILIASNRQAEASHIFKRYLGKCQH